MENQKPQSVHRVLATSYLAYFLLCSVGLCLSIFFPIKFSVPNTSFFATLCFVLGPALMAWAQITSHLFEKVKNQTGVICFNKGPYRYLRNPTQLGLVILVLGYAFATGTAMLFITTGVAYILSNIFFRKHESILADKYGETYLKYKASVKKVL
jgi:protein-S-isoprenylcysteine O-methyltransferase Ste14